MSQIVLRPIIIIFTIRNWVVKKKGGKKGGELSRIRWRNGRTRLCSRVLLNTTGRNRFSPRSSTIFRSKRPSPHSLLRLFLLSTMQVVLGSWFLLALFLSTSHGWQIRDRIGDNELEERIIYPGKRIHDQSPHCSHSSCVICCVRNVVVRAW